MGSHMVGLLTDAVLLNFMLSNCILSIYVYTQQFIYSAYYYLYNVCACLCACFNFYVNTKVK